MQKDNFDLANEAAYGSMNNMSSAKNRRLVYVPGIANPDVIDAGDGVTLVKVGSVAGANDHFNLGGLLDTVTSTVEKVGGAVQKVSDATKQVSGTVGQIKGSVNDIKNTVKGTRPVTMKPATNSGLKQYNPLGGSQASFNGFQFSPMIIMLIMIVFVGGLLFVFRNKF